MSAMGDVSSFDALAAAGRAYGAVFGRLDRVLYFAVIWMAVGAVVTLFVPEVLRLSLEWRAAFESVVPSEVIASFGEFIVMMAAVICMSIAWHRGIILGERIERVLPARTDILAAYAWRSAVLLLIPLAITVAVVLLSFDEDDSRAVEAPVYVLTVLVMAGIARCLPALAACAVGDKAVTFGAAWRLTQGHGLAMFQGYLVCAVPFNAASFALSEMSYGLVEGSIAQSAVDYCGSVVGVVGEVVCAAFLAFAYLHFTRGQPSEREPAGYFS
jgi:hypothetical protein